MFPANDPPRLSLNFDKFAVRKWLRYRRTFFLDAFKMKLNGFVNQSKYLFRCFCRGDAAGQIRDVCAETTGTPFNDNHVTHVITSLDPGLLQYVVQCTWRDINA